MTIGEKLRALRLERGLTQAELAGEQVTRNMLSAIEHGAALPSYTTLSYLAKRLNIDPGYFFDSGVSFEDYCFQNIIEEIKKQYRLHHYAHCLRLAEPFLSRTDDEFIFILSDCYYHLGLSEYSESKLDQARLYFEKCIECAEKTIYPVYCATRASFYLQIIASLNNIINKTPSSLIAAVSDEDRFLDFIVYSFLISLIDNNQSEKATLIYDTIRIKDELYRTHFNARLAASLFNYPRAKELLWSIVNSDKTAEAPFLYTVYEDLERFCKATDDYQGAYRCALAKQRYRFK